MERVADSIASYLNELRSPEGAGVYVYIERGRDEFRSRRKRMLEFVNFILVLF